MEPIRGMYRFLLRHWRARKIAAATESGETTYPIIAGSSAESVGKLAAAGPVCRRTKTRMTALPPATT